MSLLLMVERVFFIANNIDRPASSKLPENSIGRQMEQSCGRFLPLGGSFVSVDWFDPKLALNFIPFNMITHLIYFL